MSVDLHAADKQNSYPPSALIQLNELAHVMQVGRGTAANMLAAGQIGPRFVVVGQGQKSRRWLRREVEQWLANPHPDGTLMTAAEWRSFTGK